MKVPILILGVIFLVSISNAFFCYQESANTSNQSGIDGACGQVYTGSYNSYGLWSEIPSPNLTFDGNYNTYDLPAIAGNANLEINYTKPNLANSSSLWQVKFLNTSLGADQTINITIPANCWSQNPLQMKAIMGNGEPSYLQCYNGTAFQNIGGSDAGIAEWGRLYEEGMFWEIGCGTINLAGQYVFSGNLSTSTTCLSIATNNVDLNCNQNGVNTTSTTATNNIIAVGANNNVTIRNCFLGHSASRAIQLTSSTNVSILNNRFYYTGNDEGTLDSIYSTSASDLLVQNNTHLNRAIRFMFASGASNVQFYNNSLAGVFKCNMIVGTGNNFSIISNNVTNNGNSTIGSICGAPFNTGALIQEVSASTLTNLTFNSNILNNFSMIGNTISDANISSNIQNGFRTTVIFGTNNIFTNNRFQNSNTTVLQLGGNGSQFYNNYFSSTTTPVQILAGFTGFWNTTLTGGINILGGTNIGGNFYSDYSGHDCDGNGIGDTTYTLSVSDIDYLPITSDQTNCGSGGGGGASAPSEPAPTTPEEPTPTVEDQPPRTENPEFYQTPESGYPSQSTTANEIKEALPSLELDILPFKCEAFFTKANIANGEFFDKVGCEYRGVLALYKTGTPLVNGNAIILGASVLLVVLTSKKFDFIFLGSFGIMVFVLVSGFDFLLYSLTAITIIIGGGRV